MLLFLSLILYFESLQKVFRTFSQLTVHLALSCYSQLFGNNVMKCHSGFLERKWWGLQFLTTLCCHLFLFLVGKHFPFSLTFQHLTFQDDVFCHTFPPELLGYDSSYHTLCFSPVLNRHCNIKNISAGQWKAINSFVLTLAFCLRIAVLIRYKLHYRAW